MCMLAKIFLCSAPFMQEIHGDHPLFSAHSVFMDDVYLAWSRIIKGHVQIMESLESAAGETVINRLGTCTFKVNQTSYGCVVEAVGQDGTPNQLNYHAEKLSRIACSPLQRQVL